MDRQPGHLTPAHGDASPAGLSHDAPPPAPGAPGERRVEGPDRGPGRVTARRAAGFTLIEILIVVVILGIIAAIVVPQFSNASHVARENMLKDELRYLRTQINVYKAQHNDVPPGYPDGKVNKNATFDAFKAQLSGRTNARGEVGPASKAYPFGPYLQRIPPNPLTQSDAVKILQRGEPIPPVELITAADEKAFGWIYKPDTQEIVPCSKEKDARQRPYIGY